MVGCPYGWLTGQGFDLALLDWLGRLASPLCVLALPSLGIGPMAVVHPGNPDQPREKERERERGRWGLRERQRDAEGERESERDGMRPELL